MFFSSSWDLESDRYVIDRYIIHSTSLSSSRENERKEEWSGSSLDSENHYFEWCSKPVVRIIAAMISIHAISFLLYRFSFLALITLQLDHHPLTQSFFPFSSTLTHFYSFSLLSNQLFPLTRWDDDYCNETDDDGTEWNFCICGMWKICVCFI